MAPEGARRAPGGARRRQEAPGDARRRQEAPGGTSVARVARVARVAWSRFLCTVGSNSFTTDINLGRLRRRAPPALPASPALPALPGAACMYCGKQFLYYGY